MGNGIVQSVRLSHSVDAIERTDQGMNEVIVGKVRHIGTLSNVTLFGVMEFIRLSEQLGLARIISIQNPFTL